LIWFPAQLPDRKTGRLRARPRLASAIKRLAIWKSLNGEYFQYERVGRPPQGVAVAGRSPCGAGGVSLRGDEFEPKGAARPS
jgi:hypothetical protein